MAFSPTGMYFFNLLSLLGSSHFLLDFAIFAQAEAPNAGNDGGGAANGGGASGGLFGEWGFFLPLLLMGIAMYFLIMRPESKRRAEMEQRLSKLKKNDRVHTSSGIYGVIVNVQDKYVTLRIDENNNTRIKVLRTSIGSILSDDDDNDAAELGAAKD